MMVSENSSVTRNSASSTCPTTPRQLTGSSMTNSPRISDFYVGKSIFITGAGGFIGKVLLEKLLRCCDGIESIYIILRPKRGRDAATRCAALLDTPPFTFHPETQKARHKVIPIPGDVTQPQLGLSPSDYQLLINRVNIVFHVAASIKFDASLKENLSQNTIGTKNVLALCKSMANLNCYVHVSTAYSNCNVNEIREVFEPICGDAEQVVNTLSALTESDAEDLGMLLAGGRPNSYVYTKALAEHLVRKHEHLFPIAIIRPSIVTPSLHDPCPGWVDSAGGMMGFATLGSLGLLRDVDWNYHGHVGMIPVDVCANAMIAGAWHVSKSDPIKAQIFNVATCHVNGDYTWGQIFEELRPYAWEAPPTRAIRRPFTLPQSRRYIKWRIAYSKFVSHMLFALFVDFMLKCIGYKPFMRKLAEKMNMYLDLLRPFTTNEWKFHQDNTSRLYKSMSPGDQELFDLYTQTPLDFKGYMHDFYYGLRRFLLKDSDESIPISKKRMARVDIVWFVIDIVSWITVGYLLYVLFNATTFTMQSIVATTSHVIC